MPHDRISGLPVFEIDRKCADAGTRRGQTRAALGFDADAIKVLLEAEVLVGLATDTNLSLS